MSALDRRIDEVTIRERNGLSSLRPTDERTNAHVTLRISRIMDNRRILDGQILDDKPCLAGPRAGEQHIAQARKNRARPLHCNELAAVVGIQGDGGPCRPGKIKRLVLEVLGTDCNSGVLPCRNRRIERLIEICVFRCRFIDRNSGHRRHFVKVGERPRGRVIVLIVGIDDNVL